VPRTLKYPVFQDELIMMIIDCKHLSHQGE
jgi:hypothetical protein